MSDTRRVGKTAIQLVQGDITRQQVDAIVNAANSSLAGGGGVDGAIHRAGGTSLMEELNVIKRSQPGCPTGGAVLTGAGNLQARYVIHAVGPRYGSGHDGEAELLASAYRTSLELAVSQGVKTIAFPSISTGIYSYPVAEAAAIAMSTVASFCRSNEQLSEVRFVLFDGGTMAAFRGALEALSL